MHLLWSPLSFLCLKTLSLTKKENSSFVVSFQLLVTRGISLLSRTAFCSLNYWLKGFPIASAEIKVRQQNGLTFKYSFSNRRCLKRAYVDTWCPASDVVFFVEVWGTDEDIYKEPRIIPLYWHVIVYLPLWLYNLLEKCIWDIKLFFGTKLLDPDLMY